MKLIPTLKQAGRMALQWRLLLVWLLAMLLPTLALTLPLHSVLATAMDHNVHASELAERLDIIAITDLRAMLSTNTGVDFGFVLAILLTLLLSPFLSGAAIAAGRQTGQASFGQLLRGGASDYLRMLRLWLWSLLPLALVAAVGSALADAYDERMQKAIEASALELHFWLIIALLALLGMLVHAIGDAARADLAMDRRRRSAAAALWRAIASHPREHGRRLLVYVPITVIGFAVAAILMRVRLSLPNLGLGGDVLVFLLTQAAVLAIGWTRNARLFALMQRAS